MNVFFSILLAALAVFVAINNQEQVRLLFGPFEITTSEGVMLIVCFAVGVLVGVATSIPAGYRAYRYRKVSEKAS